MADADGYNPEFILAHKEPIISPQWSPDGTRIAYVSFERKKPIVFVHNLLDGTRTVLANFEGSNSAPAWSPDGKKLAVVLTKDGSSNIYSINADGSGLARLTNTQSIDTEPNFSRDGKYILFTSDRAGSPQIYRMRADAEGEAERMTFEGSYNVTPRLQPGRQIVHLHPSKRGPLQPCDAGFRLAPGADSDRGKPRSIAHVCAQRQDDPLCVRGEGAWYISRRVERWADQAKIYRAVW